jgi:hypothetical protein
MKECMDLYLHSCVRLHSLVLGLAQGRPDVRMHRVIKESLCTRWLQYKNLLYSNIPHKIDDLKMTITEYIRNVDRAILNTVFENTVRRVNKCLETGGGNFESYL